MQIRGVDADQLIGFDPSFYLLLTSVTREQWRLVGRKPAPALLTIDGREVWSTTWDTFRVIWYAWGDVLYVAMARNEQLLTAALRQMPWPSDAA